MSLFEYKYFDVQCLKWQFVFKTNVRIKFQTTRLGETRIKPEKKNKARRFVLFHSGTPPAARSTAEAASQSPFLVCPVTLHH